MRGLGNCFVEKTGLFLGTIIMRMSELGHCFDKIDWIVVGKLENWEIISVEVAIGILLPWKLLLWKFQLENCCCGTCNFKIVDVEIAALEIANGKLMLWKLQLGNCCCGNCNFKIVVVEIVLEILLLWKLLLWKLLLEFC